MRLDKAHGYPKLELASHRRKVTPLGPESPFKLESKRSLAEQVVERISQRIFDGTLHPGDKLPAEVDLADQMGVSRTALREGMRVLEAQGLLETRPGIGTLVQSVGKDQLVGPLALYVQASAGAISFDEFHTVRAMLEVEIAGIAASHRTEEEFERLTAAMKNMEASVTDVDEFAASDASFHQEVAAMTGNPLLGLLLGALRDLLEQHIRHVVVHIDPAIDVLPYHAAILKAIEEQDVDQARTAMRAHLDQVKANYLVATADEGDGGGVN